MVSITLRVRELREAIGWSQRKLAVAADMSTVSVWKMETGRTKGVDFLSLAKLAHALGVDPRDLLDVKAE